MKQRLVLTLHDGQGNAIEVVTEVDFSRPMEVLLERYMRPALFTLKHVPPEQYAPVTQRTE